jgi:hypothetical protein
VHSWEFLGLFRTPRMRAECPKWPTPHGWRAPADALSWDAALKWAPFFSAAVEVASAQLHEELTRWDELLSKFGGDPSRHDWLAFRPLRLSREEDWSDWLAHLLLHARTGRFPARLFGEGVAQAAHWRIAKVEREVVAGGFRADLVVYFDDGRAAHIEVKVGDRSLEKTLGTGRALRHANPETAFCRDFLLLPEADVALWHKQKGGADEIEILTWHNVARALRRSLLEEDDGENELVTWQAWAIAFLGAVEQRLLGFERIETASRRREPSSVDVLRLEFMKEAWR